MESSGVMLSASTARLDDARRPWAKASGSDQGSDAPVAAQRLLGMEGGIIIERVESLVGRRWEMAVGGCWTVQSTAMTPWSVWWGRRASARAADTVSDAGVVTTCPMCRSFGLGSTVNPARSTIANDRL
jgi:hypothetical protein